MSFIELFFLFFFKTQFAELKLEKWDRGEREAADDGATGRLVKCFKLLTLVTLKKEIHPDEAQVIKWPKKRL